MTSWGALLLVSYLVLGLGPLRTREAVRVAVVLTAVVLVVARGALL